MSRTKVILKVRNLGDVFKAAEGLIPPSAVRAIETEAIVDTGATYVCLSRSDIEKLGLLFHRNTNIRTANGPATRRLFRGAEIELNGRDAEMEVMENGEGTPALVGYLLLEALDFVVDPRSEQVIGNPEHDGKRVADALAVGL
ncbi:MAG: hypothetical protein FJ291_23200 [Planctomycetes bacterium]|nr:hypothetical protein [Planctomycetota bacterium]